MPVTPTFPGVYVEEIPSGVRTITGVATSITAFVGRAQRGPLNKPVTINSFADFDRIFGGLWIKSAMGFAVRDFYLNGGAQAIIVRVHKGSGDGDGGGAPGEGGGTPGGGEPGGGEPGGGGTPGGGDPGGGTPGGGDPGGGTPGGGTPGGGTPEGGANPSAGAGGNPNHKDSATLTLPEGLKLVAASPGEWGGELRARVDHDVDENIAKSYGLEGKLFNLTVRDMGSEITELMRNVTVEKGHKRSLDTVLKNNSTLVRVHGDLPQSRPKHSDEGLSDDDKKEPPFSGPNDKRSVGASGGSDGEAIGQASLTDPSLQNDKEGIYALEDADLFNLLCIPPYMGVKDLLTDDADVDSGAIGQAAAYCEKKRAMLIVDPPAAWNTKDKAKSGVGNVGTTSKNAALFFPRLRQPNPLRDNQVHTFAPCGAVAGVFARTDTQRGVWKAPAGLEATLVGVPALSVPLSDPENGELNPLAVNCLRNRVPAGRVIWGSRTRQGDDRLASEWKYIPVRRLALFIEESLYRGTQWVVFEPNDEPLWAQIRLNVGAFMQNLFRQGAFQGTSAKDAYFVKCDKETTTQNDINLGIVNIVVGFAPLKPAEFVIIKIQQMAGQVEV